MSDLAAKQAAFMAAILDEGADLPDGWGERHAAGMDVYRGNYRSSLMSAMEATFERTARYVGEGPFKRAAAHHLIANPPSGWTIDEVGAGFEATCAELFGKNPEVAEIAWLEWAMQEASTAPDVEPLAAEQFAQATAGFEDEHWMGLRLDFLPRATARVLDHNLTALWNALAEEGQDLPELKRQSTGCTVWREGEQPTFIAVEPDNARAFTAMQDGAIYGEVIVMLAGEDADPQGVQDAAMRAGQMLGGWLNEGLITALNP